MIREFSRREASEQGDELRVFADALRECLGLEPIYCRSDEPYRYKTVEERDMVRFYTSPVGGGFGLFDGHYARTPKRGSKEASGWRRPKGEAKRAPARRM